MTYQVFLGTVTMGGLKPLFLVIVLTNTNQHFWRLLRVDPMFALGGDAKKCQQAHQVQGVCSESMAN
jgi:hypothetical protein